MVLLSMIFFEALLKPKSTLLIFPSSSNDGVRVP